jgi:RsiW-degrading membrane proteinase PrsW (M82 family)
MIIDILVLASAPVILMLWYFYHRQKYKCIPVSRMMLAFTGAFALGLPALVIETQISRYTTLHLQADYIWNEIGFLFFAVSYTEELIKILPVLIFIWHSDSFDEPYDGIVYAVSAALGLAFLENVIYLWSEGLTIIISRTILAMPTHVLTSVFSGYFLGLAFLETRLWKEIALIGFGLFLAMLVHFFYNLIFTQSYLNQTTLAVLFVIFLGWVALRLIRRHLNRSPYQLRNPA